MRARLLLAAIALSLPVPLAAQFLPRRLPSGISRPQPAPLPPQVGPVARDLAYRRMKLSVESYSLISHFESPGLTGGIVTSWTSFGVGQHADYRVNRFTSATLDLTSSMLGGPAYTQTAELGTRFRPERTDRRLYPFADLRVGYMAALNSLWGEPSFDPNGNTLPAGTYARFSQGMGGVAGLGMEYMLNRSWSLTTAASVMRNQMHTRSLSSQYEPRSYALTMYRYTIGLRYNRSQLVRPPGTWDRSR